MNTALFLHEARRCLAGRATPLFLAAGWVLTPLLVFVHGGFMGRGEASFSLLFTYLPWVMALLVPALTMQQAESARKGLTERLNTLPLSPTHRLLGPWAFWSLVLGFWLAGFWPFVATVAYLGTPDFGPLVTGFVALWVLASVFWACNSAIAGRASSTAGAFVLGFLVNLAFCLPGVPLVQEWGTTLLPPAFFHTLASLAPATAAGTLASGTLSAQAAATLGAWLCTGLGALLLTQAPRPWRLRPVALPAGLLGLGAAMCLGLALCPASSLWQADATFSRTFSLSPAARHTLATLPQPLTLTLYVSRHNPDAPASLAPATQNLTALLQRIRAVNPKQIFVSVVTADESPATAYRALAHGVDEQPAPSGTGFFFGLTAETPSRSGVLAQLDPARSTFFTADVLTLITQTTRTTQPEIALLTDSVPTATRLTAWLSPLGHVTVLPASPTAPETHSGLNLLSPSPSLIVLPEDPALSSATLAGIHAHLAEGGAVMLLGASTARPENQSGNQPASPTLHPFSSQLAPYGVTFNSRVKVADPASAALIAQGLTGNGANPRWLNLAARNANPRLAFTTGLQGLLWPESGIIEKTQENQSTLPLVATPVLTTSPQATLLSDIQESTDKPASYTLATLLTGSFSASGTTPGSLLLFAPSQWLDNAELSGSSEAQTFFVNTAAFLLGDPTFAALRAQTPPRTLTRINTLVSNVILRNTPAEQQLETRLSGLAESLKTLAPGSETYLAAMQQSFEIRQKIRTLRQQAIHQIRLLEDALILINLLTMPLLLGLFLLIFRRK